MKIQKPFTAKRILAVVLGVIIFGFMSLIFFMPASSVMDTASQICMLSMFMFVLSVSLIGYGLFGGKEPELGLIPRTKKDEKDDKA